MKCKNLIVRQRLLYSGRGVVLFTATLWTGDKRKYKLIITKEGEVEVKDGSRKVRRTEFKK